MGQVPRRVSAGLARQAAVAAGIRIVVRHGEQGPRVLDPCGEIADSMIRRRRRPVVTGGMEP
jgi:hypothetical protein